MVGATDGIGSGEADPPAGFAIRHELSAHPPEAAGDWCDVIELAGDRVGLVVGERAGRGLPVAVLGQLRTACRALLLQATGPAQTLTALDGVAALVREAFRPTVFCGVLSRGDGSLRYSSAGHPPGIVVHLDGSHELLDRAGSAPLATARGTVRAEATVALRPGSVLMLYSDGLLQRRGSTVLDGIGRVVSAVVESLVVPVQKLPDQVMGALLPDGGYTDAVAVVVYRYIGENPTELAVSFGADPRELAPVRNALRGWLDRLGLDRQTVSNLLVAAGEACANAIEHGHRFAAGHQALLTARSTGRDLYLTVTDSGRWRRTTPSDERGRGLRLIHGLVPDVTINSAGFGTTVHMHTTIDLGWRAPPPPG